MRGYLKSVLFRPGGMFASAFLVLAAVSIAVFNIWVSVDADAAESRFDALSASGKPRAASRYGDRVLALRAKAGASDDELAPIQTRVAIAKIGARRFDEGAALYERALATEWGSELDPLDRAAYEEHLARAYLAANQIAAASERFARFLDLAGDEATRHDEDSAEALPAFYATAVENAAPMFAEALKPSGAASAFDGPREMRIAAARSLSELGAFYALDETSLYAAAGLLATAYELRKAALGPEAQETVQAALILGPVYRRLNRLADAEALYLEAFHAQEKAKGSNNPDLSLYIKLLADIYRAQGRETEAQALYEHMRALFRDAFGAQRYASNRTRDRRLDIDRPVSQQFLLSADYAPTDLTGAASYSVPTSKPNGIDEMKVRLAADDEEGLDAREANLPARLAQLLSLCTSETGERLTLRSGYRSYATQRDLFARIGHKGTVTPPGMSEHQLGLAVDIDVGGRLMRQSDRSYQCFEENAFRFGFILSYPPGNTYLPGANTFEPWHWRYVGIRTAQLYREAGPNDRPQEFLAALPCYQEKAAAGALSPAGETDVCLSEAVRLADATSELQDLVEPSGNDEPRIEEARAARKLNNLDQGG